jgi:hypothetical protein
LKPGECVEVFLISGSFEERNEYAGDILDNQSARIVLCSMQYTEQIANTVRYAVDAEFDIFVQWLNPGFSDAGSYFDRLGLANQLLAKRATMSIRDGTTNTKERVQEIREFIYGWATYRNLIFPCNGN